MRALAPCLVLSVLLIAPGCTGGMLSQSAVGYDADVGTRGGALFGFVGTGGRAHSSAGLFASDESGSMASPLEVEAETSVVLAQVTPRRVIYAAEIAVDVADVKKALAATKKLAEGLGGYMQRMTSDQIIVRVPAAKFEEALDGVSKMGTVTEKDITASDVTDEYVDLELRLRNARALSAKLEELLKQAKEVKDALAVETELARVRTEIERLEGRLNQLKSQVSYSTISAAFSETETVPDRPEINLPFWWLEDLGLEQLLYFDY